MTQISNLKIALGCDHAGYLYKEKIKETLVALQAMVKDFGTFSEDSVDYPDFVHPVATSVEMREFDYGILVCGSGNGVAMTANKHQAIRAPLCCNEEIAALARRHNNANIICIPARFVDAGIAEKMILTFLNTGFEGGRHQNRVNKIIC